MVKKECSARGDFHNVQHSWCTMEGNASPQLENVALDVIQRVRVAHQSNIGVAYQESCLDLQQSPSTLLKRLELLACLNFWHAFPILIYVQEPFFIVMTEQGPLLLISQYYNLNSKLTRHGMAGSEMCAMCAKLFCAGNMVAAKLY